MVHRQLPFTIERLALSLRLASQLGLLLVRLVGADLVDELDHGRLSQERGDTLVLRHVETDHWSD